jgi:hypothetical protein
VDGANRACNVKVGSVRNGLANCYSGTQSCVGGAWSECGDGQVVTRALRPGTLDVSNGPSTRTVGNPPSQSGVPCSLDPCNTDCWGYDEVPTGPLSVINPIPGGFVKTDGLSTCPGAPNYTSGPCNADPYRKCQQDFHCDTALDNCVWNVPLNYKDPACPGVDLVIGAPCYVAAADTTHYAVCNRGNSDLTAGTVEVKEDNSPSPWDCTVDPPLGAPDATLNAATTPIRAGECVDIPIAGLTRGNRHLTVNGNKLITECGAGFGTPGGGGCLNNSAPAKENGAGPAGTCAACGDVPAATNVYSGPTYHATCPVGSHPYWDLLMWDITPPAAGTWDVNVEMQTAPDVSGAAGTYTSFVTVADPPNGGNPPARTFANSLDLFTALGGLPTASNEWLKLKITLTSQYVGPVLNSWQIIYSCRPAE